MGRALEHLGFAFFEEPMECGASMQVTTALRRTYPYHSPMGDKEVAWSSL